MADYIDYLILGTAGLGGIWGKISEEQSVNTILAALEAGISAIDTAPAYGDAESFVGKALRQWKGAAPAVSTKVGRLRGFSPDVGRYDYSREGMFRSVENSLNTLGIDQLDVVFLHDPEQIKESEADDILHTLVLLKEKGYTKKTGLGGNALPWFERYLQPQVFDVLMEFNRLNACTTTALNNHLPFCFHHQMQYYAASPLNMGLLGAKFTEFTANPPSWMDMNFVKAAIKIKALADQYNLQLPSLAHRFLLSLPYPFRIVIGAVSMEQLKETLADIKSGSLPVSLTNDIIKNSYKNEEANV